MCPHDVKGEKGGEGERERERDIAIVSGLGKQPSWDPWGLSHVPKPLSDEARHGRESPSCEGQKDSRKRVKPDNESN